jgi:hypothetical protein
MMVQRILRLCIRVAGSFCFLCARRLRICGYNISQPVTKSTSRCVKCSVWAIDTDAVCGKPEERLLLCIPEGDGFESSENDRIYSCQKDESLTKTIEPTVGYNDAVIPFNGFIGNSFGQINGQQCRVSKAPAWVERSFKQNLCHVNIHYSIPSNATHGLYCPSSFPPTARDILEKVSS